MISFRAPWGESIFFCLWLIAWRGVEGETSLWKCPLEVSSLALVSPQYKSPCKGSPLSGDVYWQGEKERRPLPMCLEAVCFKVYRCCCAGARVFNIEQTTDVDTCATWLGLLQNKYHWSWKQDTCAAELLLWHCLFLLFYGKHVLIHHCHLPAFCRGSQHHSPGPVCAWQLKTQLHWSAVLQKWNLVL